jgi:hypothetical protein
MFHNWIYLLLQVKRENEKPILMDPLTLCRSNLNPYFLGRKAAFFSVGI